MDDEEIREYQKTVEKQKLASVFSKCLLMQAGIALPAFMLGRAYEAREAALWPNLLWLFILIVSSAGIINTFIKLFRVTQEE